MRPWSSILVLVLIASASWAQQRPMRFQHVHVEESAIHNRVTCILEDRSGYVWIGTEQGLLRYDGQLIERHTPGDHGPLGRHITGLAEDGHGRLWITTVDAGLSMRDPSTGQFRHWRHTPSDTTTIPSDKLNHLTVWNDTLLLITSQNRGLIHYSLVHDRFRSRGYYMKEYHALGSNEQQQSRGWCHSTLRIDEDRCWLTCIGQVGGQLIDARTGTIVESIPMVVNDETNILTSAILVDGELFACGWRTGIERVRLDNTEDRSLLLPTVEVTCMIPWSGGILAGTKTSGLIHVDRTGHVLAHYRHLRGDPTSLASDQIRSLHVGRDGSIWVGTTRGLSVHAPRAWPFQETWLQRSGGEDPADLMFHRIQHDPDHTIRISTSHGFFLLDPADRLRHIPLRHNGRNLEVTGLFGIAPGVHFIGTETGLHRYAPGEETLVYRGRDHVDGFHVNRMYQVRSLHPWYEHDSMRLIVGALGYAPEIADTATGHVRYCAPFIRGDRIAIGLIRNTLPAPDGSHWSIASEGILKWWPGTPHRTHYHPTNELAQHLPGKDARAMIFQGDTLWVTLHDAGLMRFVNDRPEHFSPPAHLPSDVIGITLGHNGDVWCTTGQGLLRFRPRLRDWLHVPVAEGGRHLELGVAIHTLPDGRIAFCANDRLFTFHPVLFDALPALPEPRLASLKNSLGPLIADEEDEVRIPYRSSAFDALVTALRTTGMAPLRFRYRLEGVDDDIRIARNGELIRYTGVPVGTYRLLVAVQDEYGRIGTEKVLTTVRVVGPVWQRWWFLALMLLLGVLLATMVQRLRERQRRKLQTVRDRIARDLHDDIGSALGSINYYSEALRRKLENEPDEMARTVADKIGSTSRNMIDQMSDIVWSVDPENDDEEALVARMRDFATDLTAARGMALDMVHHGGAGPRALGAEQRRNLFLIFKEAVHNSVKYAQVPLLHVIVEQGKDGFRFVVHDEGPGFDPGNTDAYNGNGLPSMERRASSIGATLHIESAPGRGTRVTVHLGRDKLLTRIGD